MKKLNVFQEMEIAIALSDRIRELQNLVDKAKVYEIDIDILEQGIDTSEVNYSEKNKFLKEVADFICSYRNGIFQGDIEDFLEAILAHIENIATRYKRARLPDINVFIGHDGSYTLVGSYSSKRVFSMYCSKVKGTIQ